MSPDEISSPIIPPGRKIIVAIDGPAGAGKSTIARHLAEHFGLLNLETGAMYRAFALKALRAEVPLDDGNALKQLAGETTIRLEPGEDNNRVLLDGEDVTGMLRNQVVTEAASRVSVFPAVRAWMVGLQQQLAADGGVVMEGRDIGTAVFPDAEVKIFLDAAPEVRGNRRFRQVIPTETTTSHQAELRQDSDTEGTEQQRVARQAIVDEMHERDRRDRNRAESPLRPASDAVILDSTAMTLGEVLAQAEQIVLAHLPRG